MNICIKCRQKTEKERCECGGETFPEEQAEYGSEQRPSTHPGITEDAMTSPSNYSPADTQALPGTLASSRVSLFKGAASQDKILDALHIFKIAAMGTNEKFKKLKKLWYKILANDRELREQEIEGAEIKKGAGILLKYFLKFIYSKDNLHRNSDNLPAMLNEWNRALDAASATSDDLQIFKKWPLNYLICQESPLYGVMREFIELEHDENFKREYSDMVSAVLKDIDQSSLAATDDEFNEDDPNGDKSSSWNAMGPG